VKVTHVIDSGGLYGAEIMLLHLCQAQLAAGLDVHVISIGIPGNYQKPLEEKLAQLGIPFTAWRMRALPNIWQAKKMLDAIVAQGSDIVHSHGYKGNILFGLLPRRLRSLPVISTLHGYTRCKPLSKMALNQWLDRYCLGRLDAVVIVSRGMQSQIDAPRLAKRLHVIPNGIPDREPTVTTNKQSAFHLVAIGRLSLEKNFDLLIRALPEVINHIPDTHLTIYGEGRERKNLEERIVELKLQASVSLPGFLSTPELAYQQADLLINCSTTEGMPISLLEAMREHCLFIASDIEASRALISELALEHVLYPLNAEALSNAIIHALNMNRESKNYLTNTLYRHFKQHYTSQTMARNYIDLYQKVCDPYEY